MPRNSLNFICFIQRESSYLIPVVVKGGYTVYTVVMDILLKEEYLVIIKSGRGKKWSYVKIGNELGITKQRVHQIYKDYYSIGISGTKRTKLVAELGGVCRVCGSEENLEIHHIVNIGKDNSLKNLKLLCRKHHTEEESKLYHQKIRNHERNRSYYKNCLLCEKPYLVAHSKGKRSKFCTRKCTGIAWSRAHPIQHGTVSTYRHRGCRCLKCREANNQYCKIAFKKRYHSDPVYRRKVLDKHSVYSKNRWKTDAKWRKRLRDYSRERWRYRYRNDPVFREKTKAYYRE